VDTKSEEANSPVPKAAKTDVEKPTLCSAFSVPPPKLLIPSVSSRARRETKESGQHKPQTKLILRSTLQRGAGERDNAHEASLHTPLIPGSTTRDPLLLQRPLALRPREQLLLQQFSSSSLAPAPIVLVTTTMKSSGRSKKPVAIEMPAPASSVGKRRKRVHSLASDEALARLLTTERSTRSRGKAAPQTVQEPDPPPSPEPENSVWAHLVASVEIPLWNPASVLEQHAVPKIPKRRKRYDQSQFFSVTEIVIKRATKLIRSNSQPGYATFDPGQDETLMVRKTRREGDQYTPRAVRFEGFLKEGLCEHCDPPRWYKLKLSNYWYHLQFYHGICQSTGEPFASPTEITKGEGRCPKCQEWIIMDSKGLPKSQWFRHMYRCSRGQK